MTRYTIDGSPISVAYGDDKLSGVFLSVYDDRLKYDESAIDEVNDLVEEKHNSGSYFDLHTGVIGFGYKVSKPAMEIFFRRYGVPEEHINLLLHKSK
jgi:hypothetical protein